MGKLELYKKPSERWQRALMALRSRNGGSKHSRLGRVQPHLGGSPKADPPPSQTGQPNPQATHQARQAETRPTGGAANRETSCARDPRTTATHTHTGRRPVPQGLWPGVVGTFSHTGENPATPARTRHCSPATEPCGAKRHPQGTAKEN